MPDRLQASDFLEAKIRVPSDMRTAEWAMLPQWLRERSFYMAGVVRADLLQAFHDEASAIYHGQSSMEESRRKLQEMFGTSDYRPLPGQEGTIKDLRTNRRIYVSLRTNVRLLQGWGAKESGLRAQAAVPAYELVRFEARRNPRLDWDERFIRAGGVLIDGRRIALKDSDVWFHLGNGDEDSLGVDYPPFAWGSGLWWRGVPYAECLKLGVITADWRPRPVRPVGSPNATMETRPRATEPAIRDALTKHLAGLAEWDGDRLVFTDPNGTRKLTGERLAAVWKRPMPDKFAALPGAGQMQRAAFEDWLDNGDRFRNLEASGANKVGRLNRWEDLQRVLMRLEATGAERGSLVRTIGFESAGDLGEFVSRIESDGYAVDAESPMELWRTARAMSDPALVAKRQVRLILPAGHPDARDIQPLIVALKRNGLSDHVALPKWAGLRVKRISRSATVVEIELEAAS